MGSGSRGASSGSQRCSFSTANAYSAALGKRADISEPRWNVQLSQPPSATIRTGRPAHCGNWSATSRRTSSASTVMRRGGAPSCGVLLNCSDRSNVGEPLDCVLVVPADGGFPCGPRLRSDVVRRVVETPSVVGQHQVEVGDV